MCPRFAGPYSSERSAVRYPLSLIRHSPSVIPHSPSVIRHPPFAIRHSPFAIRYVSSAIRHLSSAICYSSFAILIRHPRLKPGFHMTAIFGRGAPKMRVILLSNFHVSEPDHGDHYGNQSAIIWKLIPRKYAFLPRGLLDFQSAVTAQNDESVKTVLISRTHAC